MPTVLRNLMAPDQISAMERLYREYRVRAFALAWRLLGDRQLAEDATHQAFVQIISSVLGGETHALEYEGITVLRNTRWAAIRILQKKKMRAEAEKQFGRESLNPGIEDWVQAEARVLCEDVLRRLPRLYIEALRARYINQEPDHIAARRLGLGLDAYRSRLRRALVAARRSAHSAGLSRRAGLAAWIPALRVAPRPHGLRRAALTSFPAPLVPSLIVASLAFGPLTSERGSTTGTTAPVVAMPQSLLAETPGNVLIYSAVAANGDRSHQTIVAVGMDGRCSCEVLLRTTTAGRRWEIAPGPGAASTVVLPPDYPRDPRIFVAGAGADVMAASFGSPFVTLPIDVGPLALDPAFDSGRPFVYTTTRDGVWRLAMGSNAPLHLSSEAMSDVHAIAATTAPGGDVFVLGTRGAASILLDCAAALRCTRLSPGPRVAVDSLIVTPDYASSHVVVAYRWTGEILVSHDGGRTFAEVPLPRGVTSVTAAAVTSSPAGDVLWVVASTGDGPRLLRLVGWSGGWHASSGDLAAIPATGILVTLGATRLLDVLPHGDVLDIAA